MNKIEFNKYSVVELCGLTNVSDKNVKACFVTDEKDYNLSEILKCGLAFTSAGSNGAFNIWIDDDGELIGERMRYMVTKETRVFNSISEAEQCISEWMDIIK